MKNNFIKTAPLLKKKLRKKIGQLHFSDQARAARSLKLCSKIERASFFKEAKSIGFYAALPDEIEITSLAHKALNSGKKVFFPRMRGAKIKFHEVPNLEDDLRPGKYGILEPGSKSKPRLRPLDLILIPGRAFDKKGGRLGRGIGYYDRLLEKWPKSIRVGVCFREQLVKQVPYELHDVHMHVVITA